MARTSSPEEEPPRRRGRALGWLAGTIPGLVALAFAVIVVVVLILVAF